MLAAARSFRFVCEPPTHMNRIQRYLLYIFMGFHHFNWFNMSKSIVLYMRFWLGLGAFIILKRNGTERKFDGFHSHSMWSAYCTYIDMHIHMPSIKINISRRSPKIGQYKNTFGSIYGAQHMPPLFNFPLIIRGLNDGLCIVIWFAIKSEIFWNSHCSRIVVKQVRKLPANWPHAECRLSISFHSFSLLARTLLLTLTWVVCPSTFIIFPSDQTVHAVPNWQIAKR